MGEIALSLDGAREQPLVGRFASDERLARMVARGSRSAFALLYERHYQVLYRYCRSIVREEEDARDALQNTMMRAFAALSARERDLAVRPWLFRIAHNESITILRRRRPTERATQEEEPTPLDVEQLAGQRARLATLVTDLQTLAERQRSALVMRELNGLSIEEIAQALSTSPGAAKQALFEARSALQEMAQGRDMDCEAIRRSISERDGRVLRGRKLRAHVRSCAGCREFSQAIPVRSGDLSALAPPLPAVAAASMLAHLLGVGGGGTGGASASAALGGGAGSPAMLGGHAVGSLALKALAGTVALTAATAGTVHLVNSPAHHKHATSSRVGARVSSARSVSPASGAVQGVGAHALVPGAASNQKRLRLSAVKLSPAGSYGLSRLVGHVGAGMNQPVASGLNHRPHSSTTPAQKGSGSARSGHAPQSSHSRAGGAGHGKRAGAARPSPSSSRTGQIRQSEEKAASKPASDNAASHTRPPQTPTLSPNASATTQTVPHIRP